MAGRTIASVQAAAESIAEEWARHKRALGRQRRTAEAVLQKHRHRLRARKGVTGLDVGLKLENGVPVRPLRYAIRIHVQAKLTDDLLPARQAFQGPLDGIEIDVLERRYSFSKSAVTGAIPSEWTRVHAIIPGGCAITCDQGNTVGTLGMAVRKNNQTFYLTNEHVAVGVGNQVWQPPVGTPVGIARVIGKVVGPVFRNLSVDCALIEPSGRQPSGTVLGLPPTIEFRVRRLKASEEGSTLLFKMGATTGHNPQFVGVLDNVDAETGDSTNRFLDQITVTLDQAGVFCGVGDSGAVLMAAVQGNPDRIHVVGLVHSMTLDGRTAIACHFDDVKVALGFK